MTNETNEWFETWGIPIAMTLFIASGLCFVGGLTCLYIAGLVQRMLAG